MKKCLAGLALFVLCWLPSPVLSGIQCNAAGCLNYPTASVAGGGVTYASWNAGVVAETEQVRSTTAWTTATAALFSTGSHNVVAGQWILISYKTNTAQGATGGQQILSVYQSAGTATLLNMSSAGVAIATVSPGNPLSRVNSAASVAWEAGGLYWYLCTVSGTSTLSFTGTTTGSNATASATNLKIEYFSFP